MREPAQASSGVTYERPAILQWLEHRRVDPVTHVALKVGLVLVSMPPHMLCTYIAAPHLSTRAAQSGAGGVGQGMVDPTRKSLGHQHAPACAPRSSIRSPDRPQSLCRWHAAVF